MALQNNADNKRNNKQVLKNIETKWCYTSIQNETDEMSGGHDEEKRFGEIDTHTTYDTDSK